MGLVIVVVLGTALISALLIMGAISTLGEEDLPASSTMVPVLMGYSLGGRLGMTATTMYVVSAGGSATLLPLGSLAAIAIGVFLLARRRTVIDFSAGPIGVVAVRAAVEAAVVALVSCLFTGLASYSPGPAGEMTISASAGWLAIVVWAIVFGALFLGRAGVLLLARMAPAVSQVLRELGALVLVAGSVLGVVSIVGTGLAALTNDAAAAVPLIPVLLGNLIVYMLTLGTFGAITGNTGFGSELVEQDIPVLSSDAFAWTLLGPWSILLFVAVALVVLAAAARIGVRRPRLAAADMGRTWQLPVAGFVVGLIMLHLLVPASVSARLIGPETSASIGPSWWSSLTLAVFVLLISALAEVVPTWLYANANSLLRLCAGGRAVDEWIAGLVRSGMPGTQVPPPAAPTPASAFAPAGYGSVPAAAAPPAPGAPQPTAPATEPVIPVVDAAPPPAPTPNPVASAPDMPTTVAPAPTTAAATGPRRPRCPSRNR
ncbi:hypothetical protein [Actinomyces sp.]|uniref:hypothetical protein n=1 Tax=Actinomyces sp. TaxID=29317 RepID=UPI0026DDA9A6|nr:hypothetical protein [Actinomyces sp.]MDO4899976.1 hypothetical protein [Actinomyces sp.]